MITRVVVLTCSACLCVVVSRLRQKAGAAEKDAETWKQRAKAGESRWAFYCSFLTLYSMWYTYIYC